MKLNSKLIHAGIDGDTLTGSVNVPIYQTTTYKQSSLGVHKGYEYSRTGNPTRAALEKLIADLEEGSAGFAFASGMAATTAILSLFKSGDTIILSSNVYGGTFRVLDRIFRNFGIGPKIVDTTDLQALDDAITPDVKAILIESPANPLLTITDIAGAAAIARKHGILSIVDNTFLTPYLQRPLTLGVDIVVHSATKYLGGHSDVLGGLAVVKDPALAEQIHFIQNATGGVLQPFDSFLLIRGIKTLGVRMDRHSANALTVAEFLKDSPAIKNVYYPGLPEHPGYDINRRQADSGGGMISFELTPDHDQVRFFENLRMITLGESLGGVESLISHPATMTHASIPREIREKVGITDQLIRLSVGIEDSADLISDLNQAFQKSREEG